MKPVSQLRRERLADLVAEVGSQVAVALKLGKDKNQVHQWLLPPSAPGSRNVSSASARAIEMAFSKPEGWLDHEAEGFSRVGEPQRNYDFRQSHFAQLDPATIRTVHAGLTWRFQTALGQNYDLDRDAELFSLAYRFTVTNAEDDRVALKSAVDARIAQLEGEGNGRTVKPAERARSGAN